jgi:hypothetical protein
MDCFIRTKIINNSDRFSSGIGSAVEFTVPKTGKVNLILSEKNGRKICTLINNEFLKKGFYLKELDLSNLPMGDYCYKLKSNNIEKTKELRIFK